MPRLILSANAWAGLWLALMLLVGFGLIVGAHLMTLRNLPERVLDEQLQVGRGVAAVTADWLDQSIAPADALARSDAARRLDAADLRDLMGQMATYAPSIQSARVVDKAGRLIVAAGAAPQIASAAPDSSASAPQVLQTHAATRANQGIATAVVSVPIRDQSGLVIGDVTASIDLGGYQALVRELPIGRDSQVAVFDREGAVVAARNFPGATDAERARLSNQQFLDQVRQGVEVRNADYTGAVSGAQRIGVGVPASPYNWAVIVTQTRAAAEERVWRSFTMATTVLGAMAAIGAIGLVWFGRCVAGPLRELGANVGAMASGGSATTPRNTVREIDRLGNAIDDLTAATARRAAELDGARAREAVGRRLGQVVANEATVGLGLIEWPSGRLLSANPALGALLPVAIGEPAWARLPGGAGGDVATCLRAAAQGRQAQAVVVRDGAGRRRWSAIPTPGAGAAQLVLLQVEDIAPST